MVVVERDVASAEIVMQLVTAAWLGRPGHESPILLHKSLRVAKL